MRVDNARSARFKAEVLKKLLSQIQVSEEITVRYGVSREQAALWMQHLENNLEAMFDTRSLEEHYNIRPSARLSACELSVLLADSKPPTQ